MAVIASQSTTKVIVSEDGTRGEAGTDGVDGAGFNNVRKSKLDNPLCHLFKTNKLVEASAPTGTDSDVNFTRTTTATYIDRYGVVQSAGVNEIREEKEGFLLEGASTNICINSEDFNNWSKSGSGTGQAPIVTSDYAAAPDPTKMADRVQFDRGAGSSTSDISRINQVFSTVASTTYTQSIWLKSNDTNTYDIEFSFNGSNSIVHTVTGEWQRFTNPNFLATNTSRYFRIQIRGGTTTSQTADILMWGAQQEALPFATSYIPTTSAPVTRATDDCSITAENNIDKLTADHTLSVNVKKLGENPNDMFVIVAEYDDAFNRALAVRRGGDGWADYYSGGTFIFGDQSFDKINLTSTYSGTELKSYLTGSLSRASTKAYTDASNIANIIYVGRRGSTTGRFYGHISDFKIYDFAINDDEAKLIGGQ
jgi:hypothetical protein